MTTKEYLGKLKNIDNRIRDKIEEADKWMSIAERQGGNSCDDRVQTSKKYDKMGDAIALAVDYEAESRKLAKELTVLKNKIIKQIDAIENELYYNILKAYYIKEQGFGEIAYVEHYSYKQIRRYYEQAINAFETKYGSEYLEIAKTCP